MKIYIYFRNIGEESISQKYRRKTINEIKNDKIVLLPKSKWNSIEILIFEAFLDSNIRYEKFALINMS